MKYTICRNGTYLADAENNRILFDSKDAAEKFKIDNNIEASVACYVDKNKMSQVDGWKAWRLFEDGKDVYTKIFGLNWTLCTKDKFNFDDFTCGHFNFYVESN